MELTIYIDVLWVRTFFVELEVCLFVQLWMKQNCPVIRILWVNAVASVIQILIFVLNGYDGVTLTGGVLLRAAVLWFLFRPENAGVFARLFLWGMVATIVTGGILGITQLYLPESCWFAAGCVLCAGSMIVSLVLEERRLCHDNCLYRVVLCQGDRKVEVTGLHDTGNRLYDPYVHAPVYILAAREYRKLTCEEKKVRLIPFSTVGAENRMMEIVTIDSLEWRGKRQAPVVIGKADDTIFMGKDYRLILPAAWNSGMN